MQRIAVFFTLIIVVASSSSALDVEVGKDYGVNLSPIFEGTETYYGIYGGDESSKISIAISEKKAEITRIEAITFPASENNSYIDMGCAIINLPPGTEKYNIKVYYRPLVTGLIDLYLHKIRPRMEDFSAIIWLKVLPYGAPLPWDVTWDGELNQTDLDQVIYCRIEGDESIIYYRCDVNKDINVGITDLLEVRKRLNPNSNPYDLNEDDKVNIYDFVIIAGGRTPRDPNPDLNGDGKVNILDWVEKAKQQKEANAAPPRPKDTCLLATNWGKIRSR